MYQDKKTLVSQGFLRAFQPSFFAPLKIHLRRHKKDPNGSISFKIY